jgi:hypothetical protein
MSYDNDTPVVFIAPVEISTGMVTSSNAVTHLASELVWNAATQYAKGAVVYRTIGGTDRRFENLIPGTNSNPPEDDQDRWYDLGATDKMSMFDTTVYTQSMASGTLTVVFQPGPFDAFYLANIEGTTLSVTVKDAPGGNTIYSETTPLDDFAPDDYYEYFFAPFRAQTDFIETGLTPYGSSQVTLTVSNPGGVARIGIASFGTVVSLLGPPENGARVKAKNYTRTKTDERGVTEYSRGRKARDLTMQITVPIEQASNVADAIDAVSDIPCAVIGGDIDYLRALRAFGLLNYELQYRNVDAVLSLTVQGQI